MIELINVKKIYNYKKNNAFEALNDISFTINEGESVAIMGKSGAGKSTLMHILGCIDSFEEGKVIIDETSVSKMNDKEKAIIRNEKIGIVLQNFALVNEFTVLENVMIPLNYSKSKINKKKMAMLALEQTDIANLAKKSVTQLSGGQKQRVAIARAIVNNPKYILADEPTGALDSKTADDIISLLLELNKNGKTIIIITHDMSVAKRCQRLIRIHDGNIVEDETK